MVVIFLLKGLFIKYLNGIKMPEFPKRDYLLVLLSRVLIHSFLFCSHFCVEVLEPKVNVFSINHDG